MFVWYVPMKGNADVEAEDILHIRQRQEQFVYSYGGESQRSHQVCVGRCHGIDSEHHAVGYLAG